MQVTVTGRADLTWVQRDRRINEASLWTPGGVPGREGDSFFHPDVALRVDIGRAAIEVGNLPLHFRDADPALQQDRLGEASAIRLDLLQAWLEPYEGVRVGVQDFVWDPVGRGNPLLLAASRAESPWGELPDSTVPPFPASGTNTVPQTRRDRPRPVGITARVDSLDLTIFALVIGEGGSIRADETVTGGAYEAAIGDVRLAAVYAFLAANSLFGDHDRQVWTVGAAASWTRAPWYVGAEGYVQRGDAGGRRRAQGSAYRLTARYADGVRLQATAVRVSGDRRGDDRREGRFLSYEDNDATLIVEGNEYGLDIDNNYESVQLSAGLSYVTLTAAFFRFLQEVPLPPDPPAGVSGRSRALGAEIDALLEVPMNSQVTLAAGAGWLLGARVLEEFTSRRESHTWLLTAGVRLRF